WPVTSQCTNDPGSPASLDLCRGGRARHGLRHLGLDLPRDRVRGREPAAAARFLAAGSILVAFLLARHQWEKRRGARTGSTLRWPRAVEWRTAFIVGALLLLGGNGMVSVAEKTIPSGIAAVIIATTPIWP